MERERERNGCEKREIKRKREREARGEEPQQILSSPQTTFILQFISIPLVNNLEASCSAFKLPVWVGRNAKDRTQAEHLWCEKCEGETQD